MPIVLKETDGRTGPIVECDVCHKRIVHASDGNYEWITDDKGHPISEIFFTHKGCSNRFEHEHSHAGSLSSMELEYFPLWLGDNLQLDWKEARKNAGMMEEL